MEIELWRGFYVDLIRSWTLSSTRQRRLSTERRRTWAWWWVALIYCDLFIYLLYVHVVQSIKLSLSVYKFQVIRGNSIILMEVLERVHIPSWVLSIQEYEFFTFSSTSSSFIQPINKYHTLTTSSYTNVVFQSHKLLYLWVGFLLEVKRDFLLFIYK